MCIRLILFRDLLVFKYFLRLTHITCRFLFKIFIYSNRDCNLLKFLNLQLNRAIDMVHYNPFTFQKLLISLKNRSRNGIPYLTEILFNVWNALILYRFPYYTLFEYFIQWYIYFPLLTSSFPFRLLRSCRINGGFLHWTPTRIDYDYLFPFISTSYSRLPGTKKQTADHRKRGHREKTEGKGIAWLVTYCRPPLLILCLKGNVADNGFDFGWRKTRCRER